MRVWIVNPFDNLPPEGYRPQRYWLMSRAFAEAGHETVFWTSGFSHSRKAPRDLRGGSAAVAPCFSLRLVPAPPYVRNVSIARVRSHRALAANWLDAARGDSARPDLVVASLPPLALPLAAMEYARSVGAKFVVDVMDDWPGTFARILPRGFGWLGGALFASARRTARRVCRGADLVTAVCDRYGDLVRGYGAADCYRAYHGIELGPVPSAAEAPRRADGRVRLVYAGSLGRTYDLATVVEAVRRSPDLTLDVAGAGGQSARIAEAAADPALAGRVRFHGYLDRGGLAALLAESDVGVVPMSPESCVGVPYKFADYSAAGLAVVSSLGGESAALLARYGAGSGYPPGDADGLLAAVRAVAGRLGAARAASRRMAEAEFDARSIYADYVRRLERLTA